MEMKRTATCGELNKASVARTVVLNGWVDSVRQHGSLVFVDLRDRYGITQVVFDEANGEQLIVAAKELRLEYCIAVKGVVRARPEGLVNASRPTGEVEVLANALHVFSRSHPLPFVINDPEPPSEDTRMKYRFLDLRRPYMQEGIEFRSELGASVREFLNSEGFWEIETPFLARSTPEGARDYLVPSRVNAGSFYALPQSPQQFKQLLMVGGCDKYFQLARCFRDEDLRADRQPEFTQIDIEMAFVDRDDILSLGERLMAYAMRAAMGIEIKLPIPRLTYREAVERFASDKPDLRFGLEVRTLNDLMAGSEFNVFNNVIASGGIIRGIVAPGCAAWSRKQISEIETVAVSSGVGGMAYLKRVEPLRFEGTLAKFFNGEKAAAIAEKLGAKVGDLMCFIADKPTTANAAISNVRRYLGKVLKLYNPSEMNFLWVVDFPLFSWNEEESRYDSEHHPFTSPLVQELSSFDCPLGEIPSASYDMVFNGSEIASGSVRIHSPEVQKRVFEILKLDEQTIASRFGFFIDALGFGTPPHAGIAFGFDRLVAICLGRDSIRDVIAFPKNTRAVDMMNGAPSAVDEKQLRDLRIRIEPV
ncbi:MAG: aspartate--tRNA ligase [Candidatus Brocadiia bacterium]